MTASATGTRMRSLVTGGAGFIGSNLVDTLVSLGHDVVTVDNESATSNATFHWNEHSQNHKIDIVDYHAMRPLFDGVDFVFHLAAESRIQPALLNPVEAVEKNVLGTSVVLQCSRDAAVSRVIYSSTSAAYGLGPIPNRENQPEDCLNPYSLSKIFGEKLCTMFTRVYGLNTIALRYFNVYGERSPTGGQYAPVVGIFLEQYRNSQYLTVVGDGSQKRDFVHVSDVVRANVMCATGDLPPSSFGEVFNVGSGRNISILELALTISPQVDFIGKRPGEAETTLACIEKISSLIGWQPEIDIGDWVASAKRG